MRVIRLADPSDSTAVRDRNDFEAYLCLSATEQQETEKYLSPWVFPAGGVAMIGIAVAMGSSLSHRNPAEINLWWVLLGIMLATVGIIGFAAAHTETPDVVHRYHRHLKHRKIIEVPERVLQAIETAVVPAQGIGHWAEWPQRRFQTARNLLGSAHHALYPLRNECACGKPETCGSTTHLLENVRDALVQEIHRLAAEEVQPHIDKFAAYLKERQIARSDYNKMILPAPPHSPTE